MMADGAHIVTAIRLQNGLIDQSASPVVREDTLTILVEGIGFYTLMWTPIREAGDAQAYTAEDGMLGGEPSEALIIAAGFLFSEGLIGGLSDLRALAFCPDDPKVVRAHLAHPPAGEVRRRDVVMASSCGLCGDGGGIAALLDDLPGVGLGLTVATATLGRLMTEMRHRQQVFDATGGTHAAGVFDAAGRLLVVAEDLGRHNALDKVIGRCLFEGIDMSAAGVVLSSRLSLEMMTKAIRAGFQVVAAISAPTSLAVEVAERKGVTLCAFIRDGRATVYSRPGRIAELGPMN